MKYLDSFRLFESNITSNELVDKIKYLSHYIETYVRDINKFTTNNLNLSFNYNTILGIDDIFRVSEKLDYNSSSLFIAAVAQQFIIWSEFFTENQWHGNRFKQKLESFIFDDNYLNYTDDYKSKNKWKLYHQEYNNLLYGYVGQTIKELISGTIWDIVEKKEFTDDDKDFIIDWIYSEYEDVTNDYLILVSEMIEMSKILDHSKGYILKIPLLGNRYNHVKINYDSDLFQGFQSYFGAVFILDNNYGEYYKFCLPFYK